MLKLVLDDAVFFQKSIDAISVLIDEAEFIASDSGLELKATDPSQISMVDFKLEKKSFKEFNVNGVTRLGLDLDYLSQVMSRAKPKDSLELNVSDKSSKLSVVFSGAAKRTFEVPLIDVSSAELPNPKIDFDAELKLKADVLQDGLKDATLISTHITLGVDAEKFFMRANSSKGTLNNEILAKEKGALPELKVKNEAKSMFPLDYLSDIVKGAASDSDVLLKMKSNAPLELSYAIGKAHIRYFLAPRIES